MLLPQLLDWTDQGVGIDVAAHLGSLLAVLLFASKSRDENNSEFNLKPVQINFRLWSFHRGFLLLRPKSQKVSYFSAYVLALAVATLPVAALEAFF